MVLNVSVSPPVSVFPPIYKVTVSADCIPPTASAIRKAGYPQATLIPPLGAIVYDSGTKTMNPDPVVINKYSVDFMVSNHVFAAQVNVIWMIQSETSESGNS